MTREAVNVSMITDYFTMDGLTKKTGISSSDWDLVILKEIVDNALDAIEPLPVKRILIDYDSTTKTLSVYDNGNGIRGEDIEHSIYDFTVYHSSKRHYVTPSRGKQGNGLKTVICICYLNEYDLIWHTADGEALRFTVDDSRREYGDIRIDRQTIGQTDKRGITVTGCYYSESYLEEIAREYSVCNPDADITLRYDGAVDGFRASTATIDRSCNTNIGFYDLSLFKAYLSRQNEGKTYKKILQETFGTAIANKSRIKGKLRDIDTDSRGFAEDFDSIRTSQSKKRFTALKAHLIGLDHNFFTEDEKTGIPYCVEYSLERLPEKKNLKCWCYVNNSITYHDAWSIDIKGNYQIGNRKTGEVWNLHDLLEPYCDYSFVFHFISPQLAYMNTGKTEFDISGIGKKLCEELTRAISKEQRQYRETTERKPTKRSLIREHLPQAFLLASSNGKYCITARQLYYKVRELSGIEETATTYADYTQNILTEWLEQNPDAEDKIYFSDRGNFYIGSDQNGLGTGSVRSVINADGLSVNQFRTYGGLTDQIYLHPEFDIRYQYDKCLYIEKTGFDGVFKAEGIAEKYHMIIVSGQGFGTRAAKTLLHYLQSQGLQIYCMHDLDYSGINIINSLREPNEKFPEPITITDIGVTLEDVARYGITPELVTIDRRDYEKIDQSRYTPAQRAFFFRSGYLQRVELNAFTTAQILEIIDRKLSQIDTLPKMKLSEAVSIDPVRLKESALMRVLKKRFGYMVDLLPDPDIADYDRDMNVFEIQDQTQGIIDSLLNGMETVAEEKLNKILEDT